MKAEPLSALLHSNCRWTESWSQQPVNLLDPYQRWAVGASDAVAHAAVSRLHRLWGDWTDAERELLLMTVESIAEADTFRRRWVSKEGSRRLLQLSRSASDAATLAANLAELFPPPWVDGREPVGGLAACLFEYAENVMEVTSSVNAQLAYTVHGRLKHLDQVASRHSRRLPWSLLADLARLVDPKQHVKIPSGARTIRRYLTAPGRFVVRGTVAAHWKRKRNWRLGTVGRLTPDRRRKLFASALNAFLISPPAQSAANLLARSESKSQQLKEARSLRGTLTRQFQKARAEGRTILRAEIKSACDEHLGSCSERERSELLARLRAQDIEPADAAARICATKHHLPLRDVRSGRSARFRETGGA